MAFATCFPILFQSVYLGTSEYSLNDFKLL